MVDSTETPEASPDPLALIEDFDRGHEDLLREAEEVCAHPSNERIFLFSELIEVSKARIDPIINQQFFTETGNDMLISSAVGTLTTAGDELTEKIQILYPAIGEFRGFTSSARDAIAEAFITGNVNALGEPDDPDEAVPDLGEASRYLGDIYKELLENFQEAVVQSDNVADFLLAQMEEAERRQDRIEKAKLYFGVAIASFAGTMLANRFNRHK
jgi:hypothetical protein